MIVSGKGDRILMEMSRDDYENLVAILGRAAGCAAKDGNKPGMWRTMALTNRLLQGSPEFKPYELPEQYR